MHFNGHDLAAELEQVKRHLEETAAALRRARECAYEDAGEDADAPVASFGGARKDLSNYFISLQLALEDSKGWAEELARLTTCSSQPTPCSLK